MKGKTIKSVKFLEQDDGEGIHTVITMTDGTIWVSTVMDGMPELIPFKEYSKQEYKALKDSCDSD